MNNSPIRLLFLNSEFPPLGGGAGNATRSLFLEFAKRDDIQIECITSAIDNVASIQQFASNIRIHFLPIGDKRSAPHYTSQIELMRYLIQTWRKGPALFAATPFDLCHAFFTVPAGFCAWRWKETLPYVISLRGSDVPGFNDRYANLYSFIEPVIKRIWRGARRVVANSTDLRDLAHRTLREQDIRIIPNGVDTHRFPISTRDASGPLRIVFTQRLIGRKGLTYLLQAIEMLNDEQCNIHLTVAGDGNLRQQLQDETIQRGISKRVTFLGAVHPDQMPEVYQAADVFVLPSMNEGMSNSFLEAMSAGLAIITTSTGGARDLVRDNGVIVAKRDARGIADALREYARNPQKLSEHCRNSREIAQRCSWGNIANQYIDLYREVIGR